MKMRNILITRRAWISIALTACIVLIFGQYMWSSQYNSPVVIKTKIHGYEIRLNRQVIYKNEIITGSRIQNISEPSRSTIKGNLSQTNVSELYTSPVAYHTITSTPQLYITQETHKQTTVRLQHAGPVHHFNTTIPQQHTSSAANRTSVSQMYKSVQQSQTFLTEMKKKIIYFATKSSLDVAALSDFRKCNYRNCEVKPGRDVKAMGDASVIMFDYNNIPQNLSDRLPERHKQLWVIYGLESPGFPHNRWNPSLVNKRFNLTTTYRSDSNIVIPYGRIRKIEAMKITSPVNYAMNKTKGAYAYVTNCDSVGYKRLELMKQLKKYINVDIFGACTKDPPCKRGDYKCEDDLHKQYRFFLSFENSLCKDYITEKFWYRLKSPGIFIPVAMGGLSLDDYHKAAPPNSFLHVYNFTSIAALGKHMRYLMTNDSAYNSYHSWRQHYAIERFDLCDLCRMANENGSHPVYDNLSDLWNNACRYYPSLTVVQPHKHTPLHRKYIKPYKNS